MFQGFTASAQDEDESDGKFFKAENCFTGGSVTLSFGNNVTLLGVNPHFGYTFFNFLEAAVSLNFNYISQRYPDVGLKIRQTVTAPGAFVRIFPVKFLFAQALYEHSFMRSKSLSGSLIDTYHEEANSLLVGGGYAGGREAGQAYYYLCLLWDVGKANNSPYLDNTHSPIPILRAGMNIPLFKKRASRTD